MGEAEVAPCAKVGNAALSDIYCSVGWRHWGAKSWQCKSASNLFGIPPTLEILFIAERLTGILKMASLLWRSICWSHTAILSP